MAFDEPDKRVIEKKKDKESPPTKVIIRRLPPTLTPESLLEQLSPLPSHEFYFVRADMSLGQYAFTRAYINFQTYEDVYNFREQFDDYVFVDGKGNEYPAIVELAPYQKIPRRKPKKIDVKMASIEQDPDYVKFLEYLQNEEAEETQTIDAYLEELENKEKDMKANHGVVKVTTPLIDYIMKKREERRILLQKQREERKKKELERRKIREEDRRRRKERERDREKEKERYREKERQKEKESEKKEKSQDDQAVKVLKKPEKDEEKTSDKDNAKDKVKEGVKDVQKDKDGKLKEEKISDSRQKEREKLRFSKENREKERREKEKRDKSNKIAAALMEQKPKSSRDERQEETSKSSYDEKKGTDFDKVKESKYDDKGRGGKWDEAPEWKNSRGSKDDKTSDRPRSGKDSRSSQGRPRSGRDWDRDWDYRDRGYRDERPRSYAGSSRDDTRRKTDYNSSPDKKPSSSKKDLSASSDKDSTKGESKSSDKKVTESKDKPIKRDSSKTDLDKEKKSDQSKEKESGNGDNKLKSSDSFEDEKRKKRKERPERAIYDPRKAAERRMGGSKPDSGKTDKSSDEKSPGE